GDHRPLGDQRDRRRPVGVLERQLERRDDDVVPRPFLFQRSQGLSRHGPMLTPCCNFALSCKSARPCNNPRLPRTLPEGHSWLSSSSASAAPRSVADAACSRSGSACSSSSRSSAAPSPSPSPKNSRSPV